MYQGVTCTYKNSYVDKNICLAKACIHCLKFTRVYLLITCIKIANCVIKILYSYCTNFEYLVKILSIFGKIMINKYVCVNTFSNEMHDILISTCM